MLSLDYLKDTALGKLFTLPLGWNSDVAQQGVTPGRENIPLVHGTAPAARTDSPEWRHGTALCLASELAFNPYHMSKRNFFLLRALLYSRAFWLEPFISHTFRKWGALGKPKKYLQQRNQGMAYAIGLISALLFGIGRKHNRSRKTIYSY